MGGAGVLWVGGLRLLVLLLLLWRLGVLLRGRLLRLLILLRGHLLGLGGVCCLASSLKAMLLLRGMFGAVGAVKGVATDVAGVDFVAPAIDDGLVFGGLVRVVGAWEAFVGCGREGATEGFACALDENVC